MTMKLCALCYLSQMNNMERKSQQLNDDDFCFDVSPTGSTPGEPRQQSFTRTAVRRNTETGEISGWQEFYDLVCMDDPNMQTDLNSSTQVLKKWEQSIRHTYVIKTDDGE